MEFPWILPQSDLKNKTEKQNKTKNSSEHCMDFYQNNDSYFSIKYFLDVLSEGQISSISCLSEILVREARQTYKQINYMITMQCGE